EPDDIGPRLHAGKLASQYKESRDRDHCGEPPEFSGVEAMLEQIERDRPRSDEENENPDGPVRKAIVRLIAFPQFAGARKLYPAGCAQWRCSSSNSIPEAL